MKNLHALVARDDIHAWAAALWKSEPFRESYRSGGFIYRQVEQFAWLPRLIAEETNSQLERAHFSTWWNVIMIRDDYDNPNIHDLYYLHEMMHAATMPYLPGIGRAAFDEKMQRNELEASTLSEIQVYLEMPGLRALSFPHEIYADRFLGDDTLLARWKTNPTVAIETIRTIRRDVMMSKPEHSMDRTELWIRRFAEQNAIYAATWSDRYNEVEVAMDALQCRTATIGRQVAAERHGEWLCEEAAKDGVDHIPFRQEAELFSAFYWANKQRYAEAMR